MKYFLVSLLFLLSFQPANGAEMVEMKMSDEMAKKHELKPESNIPLLKGKEIQEKNFHAYITSPAGNGPFPAVMMVHEWWGLNKNIKEAAD
ncbi:MAG TPA: dienelactone hydrolase family protein, partial [Nitrospiria bacterium]|nr:dienelactone hydrolase family protein [Nitrospiria bacterium]